MKKILAAVAALALVFAVASGLMAEVKAGIAISNSGLNSFYLSIGEYNRVPERDVIVVKQYGIPDEELPVVFFIAAKAGVPREEIVKLRMKRWGWIKIAMKYRLEPDIFYVPVKGVVKGSIYGKAYGYYSARNPHSWKNIRLNDNDVINFVNLRFVSEHYGRDPYEVMNLREGGKNFVNIHNDITIERTKIIEQDKKKMFWQKKRYDKKHSGRYDYENREIEDRDDGRIGKGKQAPVEEATKIEKHGRDNKGKGNDQQEFKADDTKVYKQDGNEDKVKGWEKNDVKGNGKDKGMHGNR